MACERTRGYTPSNLLLHELTVCDRDETASGDTDLLIGGAINPAYYSTTGAFNGSGIAVASQSFSIDADDSSEGTIFLYFQHHTGEIRYMQMTAAGEWVGGTSSEVVAVDAKNSTPISAVPYNNEGESIWHIFCE